MNKEQIKQIIGENQEFVKDITLWNVLSLLRMQVIMYF